MHQGLERLQVVQGILKSAISLQLWHRELWRKGERSDRRYEWRVSSMDQVIEVTRHLSSEGVHHEIHLFLHHLHLCDYVKWSRNCDRWTVRVLWLWFAWGITTFRPFLVPSLIPDAFLVLLLSVKPHVLLMQLLFQIMVLLGEALYGSSESLNLSLKGSSSP